MTINMLFGFILGFGFGIFVVLAFALHNLKKLDKKRAKFAQELAISAKDIASKVESAKERINQALDISEQQYALMSGIEGPQSGPLHGKHKMSVSAELKRLEEEKITILKSVLADGYNPKLVTINEEGERESVKLSDFVAKAEERSAKSDNKVQLKSKTEIKRKLSLVKTTSNTEEESK